MLSKHIARYSKLAAAIGLSLLSFSAVSAEYRCGWIENPGPGTWWLTDKEASWEISTRGGYSVPADSIDNLPEVIDSEYVRTSGIYGYSCGCLSVGVDKQSRRILKIYSKGKQELLKKCLEESAIADRRQRIAAPIMVPEAPRQRRVAAPAKGAMTYLIQIVATTNLESAKTLKYRFKQRGFNMVVTSTERGGRLLYRVNFGPYSTRPAAVNAQRSLQQAFSENVHIKQSLVVGISKEDVKVSALRLP